MGIIEEMSKPVDMAQEVRAWEESEALKRGEDLPETPPEDVSSEEAPTADPDPAHQDDDAIDEPPKHQGNAWKAMRERIKKAEDEARSVREEMARREGEQRAWQEYQRQQQQVQQPQEQQIDPTINPIEAMQRLQQQTQEMRQYIQQQELIGQVQRAYQADAAAFSAKQTDFYDAYKHAVGIRIKQLQLAGATPEYARAQTNREELELAYSALQQGRSPAEVFYQYATQIYGYQPKGQATPPRNAQGQFTSAVETEQKKAAAATSLSGAGKSPAVRTAINVEMGAQTNGSEFDKFFDEFKKEATAREGKKKIEWR